jgi:hypothetical protein
MARPVSGLEQTTLVVTEPRPAIRPVTSSRCRIDRASTFSTKQSSPVTWCASTISGVLSSNAWNGR